MLRAALVEFYPELVETFQLLCRWCPGSRGGRGCCRGCCRPRQLLPSTGPGWRPPTRRRTTYSRAPSCTWPSAWTSACPSSGGGEYQLLDRCRCGFGLDERLVVGLRDRIVDRSHADVGLRCVTCVSSRAGLSLRARPFCVVPRRRRGDPGGSGVMCARGGGRPGVVRSRVCTLKCSGWQS